MEIRREVLSDLHCKIFFFWKELDQMESLPWQRDRGMFVSCVTLSSCDRY